MTLWVACGLLSTAVAGGSGDVLGAPTFDHASETTYRVITWDDFQGKGVRPPGWGRWQQASFAHVATTLRISKYDVTDRQEGGEWLASAIGFRAYAVMSKDFSAVKHGSRNAYSLDHEQLHFDIGEAFARRLSVKLAEIQGRGSTPLQAREDLTRRLQQSLEAAVHEMWELQERYDGETEHGQRKRKQKKWAAEVPEMFRQATEALIALRAEQYPE